MAKASDQKTVFPDVFIERIYSGDIYHKRHMPFEHAFCYRHFSLYLDIDTLSTSAKRLKLLSYNCFNALSFHDKDHGPRDGSPLRPWIERAGQAKGYDFTRSRIFVLAFPRVWGYVFNPITNYFIYHPDGQHQAILYEVKNTFGDQHGYLCDAKETERDKVFHVSPFIHMDCRYHFKFKLPGENLHFAIHQTTPEGKILTATWDGKGAPLSDVSLRQALWRDPLMSFKVISGIHWEALQLFRKGAKFIRKPFLPEQDVS